jgi:hypothetical protein
MLVHLNNSGAFAPICLFTSKETVFQFWWCARCISTLNYISIKHTGWRKSYLLNIERHVTFVPPCIFNTPYMQTYKIRATESFVIAYQEDDTSAIFAYVWVTNIYCCREAYNCMNKANYLEKPSRLATKVYCAQNVLQFSLWLFFGKFLPSTYLMGVTVEKSTETHVEVFTYKCPLVVSPLTGNGMCQI